MRSNLHKDMVSLLKKHSCANYFVMLIDPDSTDVWTLREGNKQWIYGELKRHQHTIEKYWDDEDKEFED